MMLAIMFILGQLNVPLQQIVTFVREAQDARISLERLTEIHQEELQGESRVNSTNEAAQIEQMIKGGFAIDLAELAPSLLY